MWRPIAIVLLAANLLFLAWSSRVGAPEHRATTPPAAANAPAPPVSARAPEAPPIPSCVSLGPFVDASVAATVAQRLLAAALVPQEREERQQHRDGFWVIVSSGSAVEQRRTLERVRRAGIQDAYSMPDDPQFRISLGIYSDRTRADQRADSLQPLGLTPRVEEHFQARLVHWLDVPAAGERLSASRLESFGITDSDIGAFDCP
jgi:hypothetical protein